MFISTFPGCPPPLGKYDGGSHVTEYIEFMALTIILPQDTEIYNYILLYTTSKNKWTPLVSSFKLQMQQSDICFVYFAIILWDVDPLLGNDREISNYTAVVTK
jgi:hypothetical protein